MMTAQELIAERLKKHYTQSGLAKALGMERRQIIRYEQGVSPVPSEVAWKVRYSIPDARRIRADRN